MQVVVESIGNIRFDPLRSDGTARGVTLAISLKRYEFFGLTLTDPNARPTNTTYVVVRDGDTWESLAHRVYGKPDYGDFLRRMFPATPRQRSETTVALPDEDKFDNLLMAPESFPLARTEGGIAARRTIFDLRNVPKVSTILTKV
jgi:hypothetical protein